MTVVSKETPLKRYLRENGIKVTALAVELRLDRAHVSGIVNGWATKSTTRRWAPKIAEWLDVPLADIFPGLGE